MKILLFILLIPFSMAFAQEPTITQDVDQTISNLPDISDLIDKTFNGESNISRENPFELERDDTFHVEIPDSMSSGLVYNGFILLNQPSFNDITITLASADDYVRVQESVTIPSGRNHGIFEIRPSAETTQSITIHAISGSNHINVTSQIIPNTNTPTKIKIEGPSYSGDVIQTSNPNIPLIVYVTDENDTPVSVSQDTEIILTTSTTSILIEGHDLTSSTGKLVTIPKGKYSASVDVRANSNGKIYASSDGKKSDEISVQFNPDNINIRFHIAPDVSRPNSLVHYYVWLEKDGKQFISNEAIKVDFYSGNKNIISFGRTESDNNQKETRYSGYIIDGVARGVAYTGSTVGGATVFADVENYGVAEEIVTVGYNIAEGFESEDVEDALFECRKNLAGIEEESSISEDECPFWEQVDNAINGNAEANHMILYVYPEFAEKTAYAVVGFFNKIEESEFTVTANISSDSQEQSSFDVNESTGKAMLSPYLIGDSEISLNGGNGLVIEEIDGVNDSKYIHSREFEIDILYSDQHEISASGLGFDSGVFKFESKDRYGTGYHIAGKSLPIPLGEKGSIAMISIVNDASTIADIDNIDFDGYTISDLKVTQVGDSIEELGINPRWTGSSTTISGKFLEKSAEIFPHLQNINSESITITPSNTANSISIWTPKMVHTHEPFPIQVHNLDSSGNQIGQAKITKITTDGVIHDEENSTMTLTKPGAIQLTLISDDGLITSTDITAFDNQDGTNINVFPTEIERGDNLTLDILTNIVDPNITINGGGLDFVKDGDSWTALTEEAGEYSVKVTVEKEGWDTETKEFNVFVKDYYSVSYAVASTDDSNLPSILTINGQNRLIEVSDNAEYSLEPGVYDISLEDPLVIGNGIQYRIKSFLVNGEPLSFVGETSIPVFTDTHIRAEFERSVEVFFLNQYGSGNIPDTETSGSGRYDYGETVKLYADTEYETFGLVWIVPERWDGLPSDATVSGNKNEVSFIATDSYNGTVVFTRNYIPIMVIIAVISIIPVVFVWKVSPELKYTIMDYVSKIRFSVPEIKGPGKGKSAKESSSLPSSESDLQE